jgi:membrane-bound serine protease (ClpP class)
VIVPAVVVMTAAFLLAGFLALKTQLAQPVSGKEGLIGRIGEARSEIAPKGSVFFEGEFWTARSKKPIPSGASVKVVKVENMQLEVEPVEEEGDE